MQGCSFFFVFAGSYNTYTDVLCARDRGIESGLSGGSVFSSSEDYAISRTCRAILTAMTLFREEFSLIDVERSKSTGVLINLNLLEL